jgi:hypothetical protein
MTSFRLATESFERRDIELNIAFKGAARLTQLLQAFDAADTAIAMSMLEI